MKETQRIAPERQPRLQSSDPAILRRGGAQGTESSGLRPHSAITPAGH